MLPKIVFVLGPYKKKQLGNPGAHTPRQACGWSPHKWEDESRSPVLPCNRNCGRQFRISKPVANMTTSAWMVCFISTSLFLIVLFGADNNRSPVFRSNPCKVCAQIAVIFLLLVVLSCLIVRLLCTNTKVSSY